MSPSLLEIRDLSINFRTEHGVTEAVKHVSLSLKEGSSLAIVGESGSGKSVTALSLTRLLPSPPALYAGGDIFFKGENVLTMSPDRLRKIRGGGIAYIFQEPSTSLNPVYSIRSQIAEAIRLHRPEVKDVDAEIVHWLKTVGIVNPEKRMHDYPHQLSGGMQQRAMIAMALSCRPSLLVADEPTTALDVTIQAQILAELKRLRAEFNMSLILITHNIAITQGLCDRMAVMFRGEVVEYGDTQSILHSPQHEYTKALMACIPRLGSKEKRLKTIDYSKLAAKS
ncbi:peptide/nickel transport system ATP-binding protein [Terrimicrobium sacchariphilum]|uniref:Peptide/nickel transport system ATP-binding protein n=1 Tax=Terrimicrobium sacchariphilum TaxID=690879 RepID=A0A146GA10_TERSA|nr:ABC transporter ATP-binding protein [Terrimicrobium sacchariphilum]GAT33657.1 peptide/nickel transport system ATP-binding protein [Terrimicrobium sacchariphilum]